MEPGNAPGGRAMPNMICISGQLIASVLAEDIIAFSKGLFT